MSKATNQALIDAIADGEPNSASEARAAWTVLNNELYPEIFTTSNSANIKTESLTVGLTYTFNFSKSGNRVTMSGVLIAISGKAANTNLFAFTDNDFYGKNNGTTITGQRFNIEGLEFRLADGVFTCIDAIPAGKTTGYRFNVTYFTND